MDEEMKQKFKTLWYGLRKEAQRQSLIEWLEEWGLTFDDFKMIEQELRDKLDVDI